MLDSINRICDQVGVSFWPIWNDLTEIQPPIGLQLLTCRGPYALDHMGNRIKERRGIDGYSLDEHTGLADMPWIRVGTGQYTHFAVIPPLCDSNWHSTATLPLPNDFPEVVMVYVKQGEFVGRKLAMSRSLGQKKRPHILVERRGWCPINNNQLLGWIELPQQPDTEELDNFDNVLQR